MSGLSGLEGQGVSGVSGVVRVRGLEGLAGYLVVYLEETLGEGVGRLAVHAEGEVGGGHHIGPQPSHLLLQALLLACFDHP